MAITVDWPNAIINIPRNDLTLVQSSPNEIRELELNTFRLTLKNLEAEFQGMGWPLTHEHNPPFNVGTVELARSVRILEPYTITFEDGQYAVNLSGGNTNLADRTNVNQVSVRPNNSAGLATSSTIEYSSFEGAVWYSPTKGKSGTGYPTGSPQQPVNNLTDAKLIADFRGLRKIVILEDCTLSGDTSFTEFSFEGLSHVHTQVVIDPSVNVVGCTFKELEISGTLDGDNSLRYCTINDLNYVNGHIHNSSIKGTIVLGGNNDAYIADCSAIDVSSPPIINMGGSGQNLVITNWYGVLTIENLTGDNTVNIGFSAGALTVDSTVSAGTINVNGIGALFDNSTGTAVVNHEYLLEGAQIHSILNQTTATSIASAVWDEPLTGDSHNNPTSAGRRLRQIASNIITEGEVLSSTLNTLTINGDSSGDVGAYDPAMIAITEGTGYGQSRGIFQYDEITHTLVVDRNWKTLPDETSKYVITSWAGREHVNEGLARGAGSGQDTIILNELASSNDEAYIGQTIFIRSGTGEDQACKIVSYNGTTKEAQVSKNWWVQPDSTSAYVILPTGVLGKTFIENSVWDALISNHQEEGSTGNTLSTASSGGVDYNLLKNAIWEADLLEFSEGSAGDTILKTKATAERIQNIEEGNWKIIGTQMIFYSISGEELFRFDLKDQNNLPSNKEVFSRTKVII